MYGFYDHPTNYTITDLDFVALAWSTQRQADMLAALSDSKRDAELEEHGRTPGPDELVAYPAPSETPRAVAAGILAKGDDPHTLDQLARTCQYREVLALVAHNPATPEATQRLLIQSEYAIICQGAAKHLPMSEETYDLAAPCARVTLVCRPDASWRVVARAATDPHLDVRVSAAAHPLAPRTALAALLTDEEPEVAGVAAANPHTPADALASAMTDPRKQVRVGLAANPSLPADMMRALVAYAVHLMDTTIQLPVPDWLTGDELDAVLDAHNTASSILRTAVQRDDLDPATMTTVWKYRLPRLVSSGNPLTRRQDQDCGLRIIAADR